MVPDQAAGAGDSPSKNEAVGFGSGTSNWGLDCFSGCAAWILGDRGCKQVLSGC
jgi:hypothetical protein